MITLKVPIRQLALEAGENLLIQSALREDLVIAVMVEKDGRLVILLSPPALEKERIEIFVTGNNPGDKGILFTEDIVAALKESNNPPDNPQTPIEEMPEKIEEKRGS